MKTKTPKEDPTIKSAREREERRADAAYLENAAALLDEETRRRIRRFGARANASRVGGVTGGIGGGSVGSGAGGSIGGGFTSGGGGGGRIGDSENVVLV